MAKRLAEVDQAQKEVYEKNKLKMQQYQNEVDIREMEINRVKKILEMRDADCQLLSQQLLKAEDRVADLEAELDLKSGENNRLRKQVSDVETQLAELYLSRKQPGSLLMEMDALKQDNEKLLALLKDTAEYAHKDPLLQTSPEHAPRQQSRSNSNWIPTEAVRALALIRDKFKGQLTEIAVS